MTRDQSARGGATSRIFPDTFASDRRAEPGLRPEAVLIVRKGRQQRSGSRRRRCRRASESRSLVSCCQVAGIRGVVVGQARSRIRAVTDPPGA